MSQRWIPQEALLGPAVKSPIERALRQWAEAWFGARLKLRLLALNPPGAPAGGPGARQRPRRASPFSVSVGVPALGRLRAKALDVSPGIRAAGAREKALLEEFDRLMLADLMNRLEEALLVPGAGSATGADGSLEECAPALCALVGESSGAEMLRLFIPAVLAAAHLTASLPPPPARTAPAALGPALGGTRVNVRARLGSASISIPEFRSLAPGDVLVLDRSLDEPAEFLAGSSTDPFARARIAAHEPVNLVLEA